MRKEPYFWDRKSTARVYFSVPTFYVACIMFHMLWNWKNLPAGRRVFGYLCSLLKQPQLVSPLKSRTHARPSISDILIIFHIFNVFVFLPSPQPSILSRKLQSMRYENHLDTSSRPLMRGKTFVQVIKSNKLIEGSSCINLRQVLVIEREKKNLYLI